MALPAVPAAGAKPRDTLKPRIPAFLGKDPGGMVFLQSFHRNQMPPLQRCCIGHKKVDIFFRIRLRMPPLRMVGIHHVASIIPPLRCLHLDSQEWFFVVKDEIVPLAVSPGFSDPKAQACRFSYKGRFKTLSNPLWHAPLLHLRTQYSEADSAAPPSLNPSTFMVNFPFVFRPRDSTDTCVLLAAHAAQDIARRRMRLFS
jgi:hypothetical protein